jgi:hypothetical protein
MFAEEDIKSGENALVLGPAYFDARRVAERAMANFEAEHFKPLIEKLSSEINDRLWSDVQNSLMCDLEMNMQGEIWRVVDNCVQDLLGAKRWALEKYVLSERYNGGEEIRAAVAKHIPVELQNARIADLERQLDQAKQDIESLRRRC